MLFVSGLYLSIACHGWGYNGEALTRQLGRKEDWLEEIKGLNKILRYYCFVYNVVFGVPDPQGGDRGPVMGPSP